MDAQNLSYPGNQTIALLFLVTDRLDGTTPSPDFILPPDARAITEPDSQAVLIGDLDPTTTHPFRRTVERLGLIDLTGGGVGGGIGDRLVRAFTIVGPNPVGVGVTADIGRAFDGISDPTGRVDIPTGANGIDSLNCILVPQTAQLQVQGLVASPGNPIMVLLLVWQPRTVEEWAEMTEACCCRAGAIDAEGEPFFTTALYLGANCTRTVSAAAPPAVARGSGPTSVTLTGTGFTSGDQVFFFSQNGLGVLNTSNVNVVNSTTITVDVDVDGAAQIDSYNVVVAPPLSPPACQGIGTGIFSVT